MEHFGFSFDCDTVTLLPCESCLVYVGVTGEPIPQMLWRTTELVNAPPRNVITATLIGHHWDTSAELQCYTTQPLPTVSQVALMETTTYYQWWCGECIAPKALESDIKSTNYYQWWWFGECIAPGSITAIPGPAKREGHRGWYSRGYLPHLDAGQLLQFITFRLHDSVPSELIRQWKRQLGWHKDLPNDSRIKLELIRRIEAYADKGAGACYLRDPRIARLVQQALEYFDGQRYHLIAWCIMPNHVHVLIEMLATPLEKILQSWKSYTAKKANKLLGRKGRFWMPDYFDRYIRNERHFESAVGYILENPVRAGLVANWWEWEWSGFIGERDSLSNHVARGRRR